MAKARHLQSPDRATPGNGILLSILVEDFEACLERSRRLGEPFNVATEPNEDDWRMFSIRDPDGYYVSVYAMQDLQAREAKGQAGG